jgi:phage FluMu gp28-like protein
LTFPLGNGERGVQRFLERISSVWKPHAGQAEFLHCQARTKVLACGRRWGKTDACAVQVLHALSQAALPVKAFLVAPTLEQAKILFERVVDLATRLMEELGFDQIKPKMAPYPRLAVGEHVVQARSGHRPRSLRGFEATDIVVDEAAYLSDDLIHDVLWPMMATTDGRMTLISTPNGRNGFWSLFKKGETEGSGVWSRRAPSSENPLVRREFLDVQRELMDEQRYAVEFEAEFLDRSGSVFPSECVERCLVPGFAEAPRGPFFIGIDFARTVDFTAVVVLSGTQESARLVRVERFQHANWEAQLDRIEGILREFPGASVLVDSTGAGSGPAQRLMERSTGCRVSEYLFNLQSKTRLIDGLRKLIQRAALKMEPDPVLLRELDAFVESPRPPGPSSFNAASGHDDTVIALALAAHHLPKSYGPSILTAGNRRI